MRWPPSASGETCSGSPARWLLPGRAATLCSLHRTEIGHVENGRRLPRVDTLLKLASALAVPGGRVDSRHRVGAPGSHSMRQLPRRDPGISHGSCEQRPQPVAPVHPPSPVAETTVGALHRIRGAAESQGTERLHEAAPVERQLPGPRALGARRCGAGGDAAPAWLG